MCKRNFLLCTVAGALLFFCSVSAYAQNRARAPQPSGQSGVSVKNGSLVSPSPPVRALGRSARSQGSVIQGNGVVKLINVDIYDRTVAVDVDGSNSVIEMVGGAVSSGFIAVNVQNGGRFDGVGVNVEAPSAGLSSGNGAINLRDSTVIVRGGLSGAGITFSPQNRVAVAGVSDTVKFVNTKLFVGSGIGILGPFRNSVVSLKDSEIRADVLLKNKESHGGGGGGAAAPVGNPVLVLNADHSLLEGEVKIAPGSRATFNLSNGTKWTVKTAESTGGNGGEGAVAGRSLSVSDISVLNINGSTVFFKGPTENHYQTLLVGSGVPGTTRVYNATGDARLYLSTRWHGGVPVSAQEIDRLLIKGDVTGRTEVYISSNNKGAALEGGRRLEQRAPAVGGRAAPVARNLDGISVIQVSGRAAENSFKLARGYMLLGGKPYQYVLNAYGPTSKNGAANAGQNLLNGVQQQPPAGSQSFWDFRLQSAYLDPAARVRVLAPQMASYLVMPNILFSTGLVDVSNQHAALAGLRDHFVSAANVQEASQVAKEGRKGQKRSEKKDDALEKNVFFTLHGDMLTLSSKRTPLQYGYGADVFYVSAQSGLMFSELEWQNLSARFGLLGTYGGVFFTPREVEGSDKSVLNKWLLSAYGGVLCDDGLYMDALFSYGFLKGNISTKHIEEVATLDDSKILSASATIGRQFAAGFDDFIFEPQAQFVYQKLDFEPILDSDGLKVEMGSPHQWVARVGGRLGRSIVSEGADGVVSFYGKAHLLKAFGDGGQVRVGDAFSFDPMGFAVEGGFGASAQLLQNIAFRADINYQHKLQESGVSGVSVSWGMQYRF